MTYKRIYKEPWGDGSPRLYGNSCNENPAIEIRADWSDCWYSGGDPYVDGYTLFINGECKQCTQTLKEAKEWAEHYTTKASN